MFVIVSDFVCVWVTNKNTDFGTGNYHWQDIEYKRK